ncbi:MAG: hypothetical protein WC449_00930 [Candidatus Paceibacterota bacterium]
MTGNEPVTSADLLAIPNSAVSQEQSIQMLADDFVEAIVEVLANFKNGQNINSCTLSNLFGKPTLSFTLSPALGRAYDSGGIILSSLFSLARAKFVEREQRACRQLYEPYVWGTTIKYYSFSECVKVPPSVWGIVRKKLLAKGYAVYKLFERFDGGEAFPHYFYLEIMIGPLT